MRKKLRIGIVVDQLLAGGVQLSAIEQVKELNKAGHHARLIILMRKKYPTDFSYLVKDVPHMYLSDKYPWPFQSTIKFPIFSFLSSLHIASPFLAPRVLNHHKFDILVSWGTTTCLTTQAIFKKNHTPYIAIIPDPINYILETVYTNTKLRHLFPLVKPIARNLESSFIHDALETIIISQVHKKYIKDEYAIEPVILPLGVSTLAKLPRRRGNHLLSFGRWQREKHPDFLLKIIEQIPDIKLIVAGAWISPDDLNWFKKTVTRFKLDARVEIVTDFSSQQLETFAKDALVFIHPHFEAFGLAALEAASLGLPIIIPKKSGVTELFQDSVHGFFPENNDIKNYVGTIKKLIRHPSLALKLGRNAWQLSRKKATWKQHVQTLQNIIDQALLAKHKPTMMILELGHALPNALSGGDKLMEPMARRLTKMFNFTVVVSGIGSPHWLHAVFPKKIITISQKLFATNPRPIPLFLTYVWRMLVGTWYLINNTSEFMYSSTNILPDVVPAFIAKWQTPRCYWIARVHHLIPSPFNREGDFIVNVVALGMQKISLALIKKADIILTLNKPLEQELIENNFSPKKIVTVGAGIDYDGISTTIPAARKFDGLFVGRLHTSKGIYDLVPIWKRVVVTNPKAQLGIIGDGTEATRKNLLNNIHKYHLEKNVSILGFVPDEEMYALMKSAKIFLFTDHEAGWGLAVAEAMACGLPVVGYDIGVLDAVFQKGFQTVSIHDTQAFAQSIITLIKNESRWKSLSHAAQATAKRFDWKYTTRRFEKILTNVSRK
ncbi:glycosyltransferase [Candidatus Microgenomates bacterium]|nr:MAG: glycosyltransferase [Candidatus Microgenomates bacterium]